MSGEYTRGDLRMEDDRLKLIEKLKELEVWFRKYCHKKNCKNYKECPKTCSFRCKRKLGLHTAIAWYCADICYSILIKRKYEIPDSMKEEENKVYDFFLLTHFHYRKYKSLQKKLKEFESFLRRNSEF